MYQFALWKVGWSKLIFLSFFFLILFFMKLFQGILLQPTNHKFTCSVGGTPWLVWGQYINPNPIAQVFFLLKNLFFPNNLHFGGSLHSKLVSLLCLCTLCYERVECFLRIKNKKGKKCRYATTIRGWCPPWSVAKWRGFIHKFRDLLLRSL